MVGEVASAPQLFSLGRVYTSPDDLPVIAGVNEILAEDAFRVRCFRHVLTSLQQEYSTMFLKWQIPVFYSKLFLRGIPAPAILKVGVFSWDCEFCAIS